MSNYTDGEKIQGEFYSAETIIEHTQNDEDTFLWARVNPPFTPTEMFFDWQGGGCDEVRHYVTTGRFTILQVTVPNNEELGKELNTQEKRLERAAEIIREILQTLNTIDDPENTRWVD